MAKKSYFGNRISPSCSYCLFGNRSREGNKVLCEKQGLVDADYSCKKWVYDPIKRVPKKQLNIPNQEDDVILIHRNMNLPLSSLCHDYQMLSQQEYR